MTTIQWHPDLVTTLEPHQVFVFGSNNDGFHGAGAAGYACRGDHRNNWRQDSWFLAAMRSPVGSTARIGKWAVFGQGSGLQLGREGASYAVTTVTRPGARRTVALDAILWQLESLKLLARDQPDLEFLLTPLGEGYAGYSQAEMQQIWVRWLSDNPPRHRFIGQR